MYQEDPNFARRFLFFSIVAIALVLVVAAVRTLSPPAAGTVRVNPTDGLRYVRVPSGEFQQGCSKDDFDCSPDEKPTHETTISKGFWMGQTEVTVGAYQRFAAATHRTMPPTPTFGASVLNADWSDVRSPVVNVDWYESKAYCEWAGGSLPTEAQWEYAARAGNPAARYGPLPQIAWAGDNSGAGALDATSLMKRDQAGYLGRLSVNHNTFHQAGFLEPDRFGLFDMLGNVWEWTADWYGENYYREISGYDPTGQPKGDTKVLRGGSWVDTPKSVRVSSRGHRTPSTRSVDTGFRCVQ